MSTRKLNAKTIFRLVSVLLVMALTLEFSASPVQALNYDASDSVFVQDAKASKNNEWDVTQISKQLLLAETEKDDARAGEDTAQEEQDAVQAGGDDSQAGDTSQEEVPMLANDIIVYLESGTMGTMSVEDDSSGTSDQSGIADNVILMAPQPGETVEQALDRMRSSPGVEYAEPNYLLYTQYYSGYINDPLYSEQWALEEIEMSFAWSNAREILSNNEPSPVIVAVIDTGVDSDHEDFRYEDPESEGTVVNRVLEGCNVISEPYSQDTADDSYNGHGTHIAGIIAAATYNNKGIAGTAGGFPLSVLPIKALGGSGTGTMLDIAEAIYYAVDYAADAENALVINLSLGARLPNYPKTLADAVKYAQDNGAIVVAAAGNEGREVEGFYPACLPGVISVGATDSSHKELGFSNQGPYGSPTVVAPGKDILSTLPGDDYGNLTGTSQAAAFVSGTAALLMIIAPQLSSAEVCTRIKYGIKSHNNETDWVLSADQVVWPRENYSPYDTLEIISPSNESYVSGVVDIIAVVGKPDNVARVDFEIWNIDTDNMVSEGTVSKKDSGQYIYSWDTEEYDDGYYAIYALSFDSNNGCLDDDYICCNVANNREDGLVIKIIEPDAEREPAAGALVTVHHAYPCDYGYGEYMEYEELWYGHADMNGVVIIPGTVATSGNDYFITARGTEPSFVYYATVRAPSYIEIDSSNACNTEIEATELDGHPLEGAKVLVELLESNIPGSTTPNRIIDFINYYDESNYDEYRDYNTSAIAMLDSDGKANIHLTKGRYNIRVIRPSAGLSAEYSESYYLFHYEADINTDNTTITFAPNQQNAAILNFKADQTAGGDTTLSDATLIIEYEETNFDCFAELASGGTIVITPGSYLVYGNLKYLSESDNTEWTVDFEAGNSGILNLGEGYLPPLQAGFGGGASLDITLSDPDDKIYSGDEASFDIELKDYHDNRICGITPSDGSYIGRFSIIDIDNNNAEHDSWNTASCIKGSWSIPDLCTGNYSAKIEYDTTLFGKKTSSVDFEVFQGPGDNDYYGGLVVEIFDRQGEPMPGARIVPIIYTDASVCHSSVNSGYQTNEEGMVEVYFDYYYAEGLPDEANLGLLILGESVGPASPGDPGNPQDPEPLFMFEPLNADELPQNITINTSVSPMKRVVFKSYDESGYLLTEPHYNAIYADTGNGILAGLILDEQDSGERVLWLPYGSYEYQTFINASIDEDSKLYFMTTTLEINDESPDTQVKTLGGEDLVALECFVEDWDVPYMVAVTLHKDENGMSPVFYRNFWHDPDIPQVILVTPGIYDVQGVLAYNNHTESWCLWIDKALTLEKSADTEDILVWDYDGSYSMQFDMNNPSPGISDTVTFSVDITDNKGSRVIGACANVDIGVGIGSLAEDDDIYAQDHYKIAPFIHIKNPQGEEVFRYKDDGSSYDLLMMWNMWDAEYVGTLRPIGRESTFFGAEYTVPEGLHGGEYTAVAELDLTFLGELRKEIKFNIDAGLTAPVLNQQEPLVTNAGSFTVSGTASPNATVKFSYTLNNGEKTEAGTVQAGANGSFAANITLPSEGTYIITAVVTENGLTSGESNEITVTVDRTPPGKPVNLTGDSPGQSVVNLTWGAPSGEEPGDIRYEIYRIYYDEDGVQQETIIAENLQFSQTPYTYQDTNLNADTEYTYRIYAIDIAGNRSNAANITVRTSKEPDMVPPTKPANLRAGYDGSTSSVDITWNASTDNVGVNGYKVYRRLDNSNDWVHIGTVASSSALTYNDDSLYAETKYWYSVSAYDEAGNESEKSEPVAVTTPPLNLDNATLRVKKDRNGLTAVGNEISFTVYGAKNRTAYIEFKLDCWETGPDGNLPESPVEKTETIQLEESKDSFGNVLGIYQGKYTIPENTAAVKSAKAFISDEAEPAPHLTSTDMAGLPVYVSGTLTVTISETSPEAFNAIRSGKLSIWSNSEKSGDYKTVDNPGTYTFNGLIPGSDYLLKLTGLYDQVVFVLENIEVQRGRNTTVTIDLPETVNLYIRVVDETGNPVQDALVTVIDPDTGFTIVSCLSNEDGWAAVGSNTSGKQPVLENRFFMGKVSIKTSLPSQDLKLKFDPEAVVKSNLIPGNNEIEIELDKRPMGVLEGVITGFNGNPLRDASLRIIQIVAGEYVTRSIKTDEDGRYSIELNTGSTGVSISHWRVANNSSFFYNVLIRDDETTTLDVTLKPDAYIKINAYTQLAGELEYPIVMDSWRVSSSFKITIRRTDNPNQYVNYRMAADGLNCTFIIQDANPGDQFEVTLEDKNVGLGSETVTVELNEDGFAIAEIHLIEKGLLKADVRDQQGLKRTGFSRKVWIYDGNNPDSSLVTSITSGSNDISVNLEEGEYTAVFSWGAGQQSIASGYMPDESYMLTLGALEDHLSSMQSLEYVKVENIGVTFNQITDLSRIGVPYISYTSGSAFSNEESWLISNKTTAGPNSVITLQARYQLSDEFDMSRGIFNPKLRLGIPNGTTLIEESIVIETENDYQPDVVISSLSAEYFEINLADFSGGGNLCSNSGTITYQVRVKRQPEWPLTVASASMSYESRNISGLFSTVNEMLGEVHIEIPYISISAPEVVTSPIVNIKGYAPPDTDIRIYDGSCLLAETRVSRYGTWMQEVELADKGDPSDHWLYAKLADEEGNELAYGQTMVTYDSMYPVINRITMGQYSQYANDGHVVSYNPSEGIATFPYVYAPSMKTYFIIEFSNANRVKPGSVVVRSGNGFSLEAEYREDTRDYYASEKITGQMGTNYMPGPISVEYEVKPTEWSIPSEIPGEDDIRKSLPDSLKDADVSVDDPGVYEPGPDGVYRSPTVTVRSSGMSGTDFELQGWITLKFLENYPPAQIPGANPAIAIGSNSSGGSMDVHNYHCSITRQGNDGLISCGYTAPIEAFDDTPVSEMSMQALPSLPSIYKGVEVGFDIIDKGNTFVEAATNILNGPGMFDELEGLLDYVDKNCTGYAPDLYYNLINMEAEGMMKDFAISSSLQLVSFGISATGFGAAVGIPTFLAGSLMGYIMNKNREDSVQELKETIMDDERCKDEEEEDDDDDNDSRDKKDKQKVSDHDYILDPSGYVYEAVPENRIEGVRATLFEYNVDQEIWEVWDSRYYGQDNPLFTDAQGRYAWDVPEGDWRVMYEKDGYVTTNSWEMHVPPPHTDVNIGLVSFAAPSVSSVTAAGGGEYIEITFNKYMKPDTIGDSTLQVQKDGEVDDDNDPVFTVGDIVPVNLQPSPGSPDPNDTLARIFRFVPETPLEVNGRYDVRISSVVQSYAGSIMGEDFTVSLTVPENAIPVTSVTLNRSSLTLYPGESSRLTATVLPANATVRTVSWQSSNPGIAGVDNTGLVTANATGTSVITVTTTDGGYTSTCTVNVIPIPADDDDDDDSDYYYQYVPVTGITLDKTELSLIVRGEPVVLNSTVLPPNATNKNIVWSSSNQKVAVVQNGRVTPVGAGTAIITAKTSAGGYSATCTVTVKPAAVDVFSGKVGANSAVIEAFDGDISLVFETASFLSDTGVTIERFDSDGVPDGYIGGSSVFDISFGGNEPRKSVILMTRYDQKAAEETNPLKFVLYKWDEDSSAWVYAGGAVSTESGVVVAEIEAPGRYMLMAYDRTFSDISSHWSRDEVEVLASRRVIAGYANNEFRPENQITRGEFIKLVMSMVPYCPYVEAARSQTTGTYDDVTSDKWYFPYVEAATELGIVTGSGGSFRPEDPISREEMAVILIRIFNTPAEMEQAARECPVLFNDSDDISGWALGAVILANQKGIIKGDASGNFRPKDYAKRAEAAAVILRTMENLGFIKAPESLKGTLRVVEIEGTHFELEVPCTCPSGKTYYVIIPADCIIEKQLGLFINKEVQITGILQDEPNIYMRGPVLKAISIGDRIRTACAKCSQ